MNPNIKDTVNFIINTANEQKKLMDDLEKEFENISDVSLEMIAQYSPDRSVRRAAKSVLNSRISKNNG